MGDRPILLSIYLSTSRPIARLLPRPSWPFFNISVGLGQARTPTQRVFDRFWARWRIAIAPPHQAFPPSTPHRSPSCETAILAVQPWPWQARGPPNKNAFKILGILRTTS